MKEFTQKVKDRGWKIKDLAERWGLGLRRLQQIAAEPGQLHEDAVAGLPANLPGSADFDDFVEVLASGSSHNLAMLILVATNKYGWSDDATRALAGQMIDLLDYADLARKGNGIKRTSE